MPSDPIPYLIVSQSLDVSPAGDAPRETRVYVCLNLLDHRAIGIATSRDAALEAMQSLSEENDVGGKTPFDFGAAPPN